MLMFPRRPGHWPTSDPLPTSSCINARLTVPLIMPLAGAGGPLGFSTRTGLRPTGDPGASVAKEYMRYLIIEDGY